MTPEEKHLWYDFLKKYNVKFYRQRVLGYYVADFYCAKAGLVIELDGVQHYTKEGRASDLERTERLEELGLTVVRISNHDVHTNFEGVCLHIDSLVKNKLKASRDCVRG